MSERYLILLDVDGVLNRYADQVFDDAEAEGAGLEDALVQNLKDLVDNFPKGSVDVVSISPYNPERLKKELAARGVDITTAHPDVFFPDRPQVAQGYAHTGVYENVVVLDDEGWDLYLDHQERDVSWYFVAVNPDRGLDDDAASYAEAVLVNQLGAAETLSARNWRMLAENRQKYIDRLEQELKARSISAVD